MQRAPYEGGIDALVGELLEIPRIPDPAAGHELHVRKRAAKLAQEVEVGARGHPDPGEVEDNDRAEPRASGELGDVERVKGAERGIGGGRLTGAEVEGEDRSAGVRLTGSPPGGVGQTPDPRTSQSNRDREPLESAALISGARESLEPHDHPGRTVQGYLAKLVRGADAGVYPQIHVRQLGRDRASQLPLRRSIDDRVEIGDIKLPKPEPSAKGPRDRQRVPRCTGRELRYEWRVAVAIPRPGVHGTTSKYVQYWNYTHRSIAARVGIHGWVAR